MDIRICPMLTMRGLLKSAKSSTDINRVRSILESAAFVMSGKRCERAKLVAMQEIVSAFVAIQVLQQEHFMAELAKIMGVPQAALVK